MQDDVWISSLKQSVCGQPAYRYQYSTALYLLWDARSVVWSEKSLTSLHCVSKLDSCWVICRTPSNGPRQNNPRPHAPCFNQQSDTTIDESVLFSALRVNFEKRQNENTAELREGIPLPLVKYTELLYEIEPVIIKSLNYIYRSDLFLEFSCIYCSYSHVRDHHSCSLIVLGPLERNLIASSFFFSFRHIALMHFQSRSTIRYLYIKPLCLTAISPVVSGVYNCTSPSLRVQYFFPQNFNSLLYANSLDHHRRLSSSNKETSRTQVPV